MFEGLAPMEELRPVAWAERLVIHGYVNGSFSLSNSPFYGHHNCAAIDLYPGPREFCSDVPSPVAGSVIALRRFSAPTSLYFERPKHEYVIVIENADNPSLCYKILHADPGISVGEKVEVGDSLGTFVRSGLFCFWTDPHLHVEIRDRSDPVRARGGHTLQLITSNSRMGTHFGESTIGRISGSVVESRKEYIIIKPAQDMVSAVNGFFGVRVRIGNCVGILDGGVPHYGYGGVFMEDTSRIVLGAGVYLRGVQLGSVTRIYDGNYLQFECNKLSLISDSVDLRGISSYLHFHVPTGVKLVCRTIGKHRVRPGQNLSIELEPPAKGF